MAELTNKLHVKSGSTVYDCTCYTTTDEATPKTVSNGSYWEIKNNNTVCYLGLVPSASAGKTGFDTPLKVKKNNTEYIVQTKVANYFTVTITQSANQTITVTCGGKDYTSTFSALAGSQYTVKVTPNTGYTAGTPNVTSGYVNSNISISATAATKATYVFTINKTSNQTITVTYGGTTYKSTASSNTIFTATYGEKWTATIAGATGYNPGTLSATSGTITGAVTLSATAATIKTFTLSFGATTNQTYVATIGGTAKAATSSATSYTVNYGTSYSVAYTAASATAQYTYTASDAVSGTVTADTSIPEKSATATTRNYTLTLNDVSNGYWQVNGVTKAAGSYSYPYGTSLKVECFANSGYVKPSQLTMS